MHKVLYSTDKTVNWIPFSSSLLLPQASFFTSLDFIWWLATNFTVHYYNRLECGRQFIFKSLTWDMLLKNNEEMARGYMLLKSNEEMGEAGLCNALSVTNRTYFYFSAWPRRRSNRTYFYFSAWPRRNNMYVYIYFAKLAHVSGVVSM